MLIVNGSSNGKSKQTKTIPTRNIRILYPMQTTVVLCEKIIEINTAAAVLARNAISTVENEK